MQLAFSTFERQTTGRPVQAGDRLLVKGEFFVIDVVDENLDGAVYVATAQADGRQRVILAREVAAHFVGGR